MDESTDKSDGAAATRSTSIGYAASKIARALTTQCATGDDAVRERARIKVEQWEKVIGGIVDQSIDIGSRTPLGAVPAWATLEVLTGGFATGELKAGGPLLEHELHLLAPLGGTPGDAARCFLNSHFLTDRGIATLQAQLASGCYEITVPEEGALLVVAWLVHHGKAAMARDLLDELAPWFSTLRFYPVPSVQPLQSGLRVFLKSVKETLENLRAIRPNQRIQAQTEAVSIWIPMYDQAMALFLETVEGDLPRVRVDANGAWADPVTGKFFTEGGWPCRHYPADWAIRAQALLETYDHASKEPRCCPERGWDSVAQLIKHLRQCATSPKELTARDVGRIRLLLARYVTKRGEPGSIRCANLRARQIEQTKGASHHAIAGVVIERLESCQPERGLDDVERIKQPVSREEGARRNMAEGTAIPRVLQRKVARCHSQTVDVLVGTGVICSAEVLATVLPQMSANINAAGIDDRELQRLYGALYQAFRRRRSLLLLDLKKQVQLEELPWVSAIDAVRQTGMLPKAVARQTLEEIVLLTLASFPHTIIPNKLLPELLALAKRAEVELPLVEELAADIFMGQFSGKFLQAAQDASALLDGTVYAQYYGIDARHLQQSQAGPASGLSSSYRLLHLCEERAGVGYRGYDIVLNRMLIEQQQILTSQNLAVLISGLDLRAAMQGIGQTLAQRCFEWICRRLQMKAEHRHAELTSIKNAAYAWRQMMFFLALAPSHALGEFLLWAADHLEQQDKGFRLRFTPALLGLQLVAGGASLDDKNILDKGARRLLAYSKEGHWLLA